MGEAKKNGGLLNEEEKESVFFFFFLNSPKRRRFGKNRFCCFGMYPLYLFRCMKRAGTVFILFLNEEQKSAE
jgi:hypothetical protein